MSKNKQQFRYTSTVNPNVVDVSSVPKATPDPLLPIPAILTSTEQWLVTHDSKQQQRPPHTEIVNSSIHEWLNRHNDVLFITFLTKIQ